MLEAAGGLLWNLALLDPAPPPSPEAEAAAAQKAGGAAADGALQRRRALGKAMLPDECVPAAVKAMARHGASPLLLCAAPQQRVSSLPGPHRRLSYACNLSHRKP